MALTILKLLLLLVTFGPVDDCPVRQRCISPRPVPPPFAEPHKTARGQIQIQPCHVRRRINPC
jgi:hypothetical protein